MIRSLPFGDELKGVWETITTSTNPPFYTYAWHAYWWDTFHEEGWTPRYLVSDTPIGIIPLIQHKTEVFFSGGEEIADYIDCLGNPDDIPTLWNDALIYLRQEGVSKLTLYNIPQHSPTLEVHKTLPQAVIEQIDTTPIIDLPKTWEEHLLSLSRKDRHEIRRKMKKFELEHPDISLIIEKKPTKQDIGTLIHLMKLNPEKQQFFARPHMEEFFFGLSDKFGAALQTAVLMKNNSPIASLLAFIVGNEIQLYNSGFDETNYPGAGLYLKTLHLKWAIENGFTRYNFLQGDERYKYDLGAKDFPVYKISLTLS